MEKKEMGRSILTWSNDTRSINMLRMQLYSEYNFKIIVVTNIDEAIKILSDKKQKVNCIIGTLKQGDHSVEMLAKYCQEIMCKIPFILFVDYFPTSNRTFSRFLTINGKKNQYLKYPVNENDFLNLFQKLVQIKFTSSTEKFRRIDSSKISFFQNKKYPIYIRDHEKKYTKIEVSQDELNEDFIYFVSSDDYEDFFSEITELLKDKLYSSKITTQQKVKIQYTALKKVHQIVHELGLTEREIKLTDASVDACKKIINKNPRMSTLLGQMINYQHYTYELALMTAYLSSAIVSNTSWASKYSIDKMCMAALIQDISLNEENLARISDINSKEFKGLDPESKQRVVNHPLKSVELMREIDGLEDIANNIANLIEEHHERPNKETFPKNLSKEQFSPLSCIFIMAHEFSHRILEKKISADILKKILVDFEQDYSKNNFKKPYQAFIKTFAKHNK